MKSMNLKRFASTVLAMVMALALAVPAFAAENTTNITGGFTPLELKVTVPDSGEAIINPYGLPYKMGATTVSGQQITTGAPLLIQNKSAVALKVTAKVSGAVATGSGVQLTNGQKDVSGTATTIDFETETEKMLHVEFQAFEAPGVTAANVGNKEVTAPMFAALKDADAVLTADVLVPATGTTGVDTTGDLVLKEGDESGQLQEGGAAFIRLSGEAAQEASWAETDTFTATIAFTFKPSVFAEEGGTLALQQQNYNGTDGTFSYSDPTTAGTVLDAGRITLTPPNGVTVAEATWTVTGGSSNVTITKGIPADATLETSAIVAYTGGSMGDSDDVTVKVVYTGDDGKTYTKSIDVTITVS